MILALSHATSRYFWRCVYPLDRHPSGEIELPSNCKFAVRESDVHSLAPSWAVEAGDEQSLPVHAIVLKDELRRRSPKHVVHSWTGHVPEKSFFQLNNNVYITSPAFEFLMLASQVELEELVAYGNELCGLYSFDASNSRGFRSRTIPLTNIDLLGSYLKDATTCRGYKRAKRALGLMAERSASPMETTVQMLNCLPYRLGGYGLDMPIMNHPVALLPAAALIAQRNTCIADMCYPEVKLDIEYHGRHDHDSADSFDSDRARVNGLVEMGYEVIELTYRQVSNLEIYEAIVRHIAKRIGKRIRKEKLGAIPARCKLRRLLLAWNRRSGEPG